MTQEDKELLLKDLCARLPYEVNVLVSSAHTMGPIRKKLNANLLFGFQKSVLKIKPYLFPLSSMTEEQKQEYTYIVNYISPDDTDKWKEGEFIYVEQFAQLMHFYHINHLDYMGLIEEELAIDATGKNIY